ncbi:MAG: GNAT family N-acetyltransferase [Rickettsiales bacterium]|jgi:ribosomal-protein-serine acetyltransferase|nr:GNAT family N-acetyltransferase [Rickettsiales bacterium]
MLIGRKVVVDSKIYLEQLDESDAESFFNLTTRNIGVLINWFEWATELSLEKSKKFIENSYWKNEKNKGCDLGIYYENNLIGVIAIITYKNTITKGAEIAYWLSKDMGGKGIMTKVVKKVEEYCFTKLNFDKLFICAFPENIPSRKIPEKLNYTLIDADIDSTEINNKRSYYLYYVKNQSEYKSNFWNYLKVLIRNSDLIIDSKKGEFNGSLQLINPVDFGYFKNDWDEQDQMDCFVGSEKKYGFTHILCVIDFKNKLSDIKILYNCSVEEKNLIFTTLSKKEGVLLVPNPDWEDEVEDVYYIK